MKLDLEALKSMVERAADLTSDAREMSERDRDYYDGNQWTAAERAVLRKRRQPIITINRIKRKIDAMVGIEQRGRVDPSAYPRNPGDEEAADIATKALRFVEETESIDVKRSAAFENLLVEGYGGVEVVAEPRGQQLEVCVRRLRWEEIFFDPHSREKDFSDAGYMGVRKWMTIDRATEFASQFWQGSEDDLAALLDAGGSTSVGTTYEDRPQGEAQMAWADKRMKRVLVAQMYYRRGAAWYLAIFTGMGELYNEVSPYLDENGKPDNAIVMMSAYVDRENRRYGAVRDMISPQDEVNKRRSKALHAVNNRQSMGLRGAVDVAELKRQLALPDGHVEIEPAFADGAVKPFEVLPTGDLVAGQLELLQEAKSEIDMLGPNASLLGQLEGQQSGRAIMAQQQAGLAELAPIYDSLRDWTQRVYRKVWLRIRQFWAEPRWVRVTDDMEAPRFVGINQVQMTPWGPQMMNAVGEIDVDIIVDQAPDYATLRAEQFEKLVALAEKGYPLPPEIIIEASDLRDKRRIVEAMQGDPQQAAEQQAMQQEAFAAEVETKHAKAFRDTAAGERDLAAIGTERAKVAVQGVKTQIDARKVEQAGQNASGKLGVERFRATSDARAKMLPRPAA